MKTTTSISALVVGTILTGLTIQGAVIAAIEAMNRTKWGDPDLSGTYVSERREERCNILVTGGTMPAVHITQSPGLLTLRSNTTRVLHIQKRTHGTADVPTFIRYGLARWEDDDLVVESRMPTAPLWSEYQPQPPGVVLVERFSLTDPTRLTYEIGYNSRRAHVRGAQDNLGEVPGGILKGGPGPSVLANHVAEELKSARNEPVST